MAKSKLELVLELAEKLKDPKFRKLLDVLGETDLLKALKKQPPDWKTLRRTCVKCGHEGPVLEDFGLRKMRGKEFAQGWCRKCRSAASNNRPSRAKAAQSGE